MKTSILSKNKKIRNAILALMFLTIGITAAAESIEAELEQEISRPKKSTATEIITSKPYVIPRLFTLPTAYSLRSYGLRFGGEGNIHSALANLKDSPLHASVAIGLGGVIELGYQLEEFLTADFEDEDVLMGWFKMSVLKETPIIPALSLSVGKNLRKSFETPLANPVNPQSGVFYPYKMERTMIYGVLSKSFHIDNFIFSIHPGVQYIKDELTHDNVVGNDLEHKTNLSLGMSWQADPKKIFMFETKYLTANDVETVPTSGLTHDNALENNLGVRYYLRNWLCMDAGVRYFYNLDTKEDDTRLHANFVGVIPLNNLYTRIENFFKN